MDSLTGLAWTNRFADLGPDFFTELPAEGLPDPHWVAQSPDCAQLLGLPADWTLQPTALPAMSGNAPWPGMRPLASVYSGHQFGVWAGQLGDGRALWLGEVDTPTGPQELQLKGAGLTPYSRRGDGRAVLRSSIREFLCSEAMAALGVPTTRALCITGSRLPVIRETVETAAVVTRVAPSFIRFGHFEHFAHHDRPDALRRLVNWFIAHHAPECADEPEPVVALLRKVSLQTADLIAHWQAIGFCHGVMNTDNMSMLGLTLDYGPFGFMDGFDPSHVCNHSDDRGRYAYARQPAVAFWNLHALAQALLPLMPIATEKDAEASGERLLEAVEAYRERFAGQMLARLRAKLGLVGEDADDQALADDFLKLMAASRADFTQSFRRLSRAQSSPEPLRDLFVDREALDAWLLRWRARAAPDAQARMLAANPAVVLRNHLAEGAIRAAQRGDFTEIARLLKVLGRPFDEPEQAGDAALPPDWASSLEVSCSS
ncbi:YdiU family protein [Roseateles sp.]|uniref:protein adenylyltransferase SelO n=1 Tax=Roseateles sp. TaxID=1971397 RepID=UPI0025F5B967|nr:YdiU family protein [Roseateles sp.]MBV8033494.1 YdiU family protein [Roseateles sp.]